MNRLFDDNHFDKFVDSTSKLIGISNRLITMLKALRERLNNYDDSGKTDDQILNDPNWHEIVDQTSEIIQTWKSEQSKWNSQESGN
ncbi:MAG: hypothetical protein ACOYXA_06110 [Bacteroidota bacterium]